MSQNKRDEIAFELYFEVDGNNVIFTYQPGKYPYSVAFSLCNKLKEILKSSKKLDKPGFPNGTLIARSVDKAGKIIFVKNILKQGNDKPPFFELPEKIHIGGALFGTPQGNLDRLTYLQIVALETDWTIQRSHYCYLGEISLLAQHLWDIILQLGIRNKEVLSRSAAMMELAYLYDNYYPELQDETLGAYRLACLVRTLVNSEHSSSEKMASQQLYLALYKHHAETLEKILQDALLFKQRRVAEHINYIQIFSKQAAIKNGFGVPEQTKLWTDEDDNDVFQKL